METGESAVIRLSSDLRNKVPDRRLRHRAHELRDRFAVPKRDDRGQGANLPRRKRQNTRIVSARCPPRRRWERTWYFCASSISASVSTVTRSSACPLPDLMVASVVSL